MPKNKNNNHNEFPRRRIQFGLIIAVGGFLILMVGAKPELFLLDRSPVLGFIQVAVMLAGLALVCIGGYTCLSGLWKGHRPSIAAEIGMRVISTGYIIAVFAGLADIFGLGSHPYPEYIPYFGEWQARGVQIAEGFIAIGMLMLLPYSRNPLFRSRQSPPNANPTN
ncbi:MAG TPA: hypothetical protein VMW28_00550 [Pelolinea sp.]|nr:hypothetical protein [Pelolinea sp.]